MSRRMLGITLWLVSVFTVFSISFAPTAAALDSEEMTNISVYEKAAPAVVDIAVQSPDGTSSGTGVIIDRAGIILTSSHVVEDATTAKITLATGETYTAHVLAQVAKKSDLAILKIQADKPLPFVSLGNSSELRVGQKVLAIGNPYGFDRTLTTGIISRIDPTKDRIQTDASINPGNSGGPLLNTSGEIIGINQSIFNPDGRRTNIGIGFAVPVDTVKTFIRAIAYASPNTHYSAPEIADTRIYDPQSIPVLFKHFNYGK